MLKALSCLAALATASALSIASPLEDRSIASRWSPVCTVAKGNGGDDSPAFQQAAAQCANGGTILFSAGVDYNLMTPINATLNNVEVSLQGNLHLPKNITYVQGIVNASTGGNVYWISLKGNNVWLTGTNNVSSGWIYGYGQQWWDANPKNGSGIAGRPHLLLFNVNGGQISNYKVSKPIGWVTSLQGTNIHVQNVVIDANTRPNGGFPFNTDGFDVSATNVLIEDFVIANGDDAVTINNGGSDITVRNGLITGPGCHGTSVGSLGQNQGQVQSVKNILFTDISVNGCVYGARFKSYVGGQGLAQNITWQNYHISNTTIPIYVTQNYFNQGSTQTQLSPTSGANGNGGRVDNSTVIMKDFTFKNWKGTINSYKPGDGSCVSNPCWYDVPGADGTQSVIIQCTNSTSCQNYHLENIDIIPETGGPPTVLCNNLPASSNPNLGFVCTNGTFSQTSAGITA